MPSTIYPAIRTKLDEGAHLPTRAHATDAGADLRCRESVEIKSKGFAFIETGVHIELPEGYCARVEAKSGLWRDHHIFPLGLIDCGYDGSIGVTLANLGDEDYTFVPGEKVAQLTVSTICTPTFVQSDTIEGGARGSGGYGSTGRL